MSKKEYQNLLNEVQKIRAEEDNNREVHLKKGAFFNIFNVVGKSSDEVNIHSKFLAMLLNPKGDHGCGDAFLKSFCENLRIDTSRFDVDVANVSVSPEYDIGPIRDGETKGGRIDILIRFEEEEKKFAIIIENKIYAGDQNNQLLRYKNYAEEKFGSSGYKIFYLTPDGHEPDKKSTGINLDDAYDEDVYWTSISYEEEIKSWLKKWLKTQENKKKEWIYPIINQYVHLIDSIAGNAANDDVFKKICEILKDGNNLFYACKMRQSILDVKKKIFEEICSKLFQNLIKNDDPQDYWGKCVEEEYRWLQCHIYKHSWKCRFTFELDIKSFDCKFGITLKKYGAGNGEIEEKLRKLQDYRNRDKWWMIWDYLPDEFANWKTETFASVNNDDKEFEKLSSILQEKIYAYIPVLDELVN